jgi:8-oxo-dGTP pyrophosphatase MutT (NUDIX family)
MNIDERGKWTLTCFEEGLTEVLRTREKKVLSREGKVVAAVLVPLFGKDGHLHVLLTRRSQAVEHHKGEISFPGGRLDDTDPDLLHCALRETCEEVGVRPADVRIAGELDDFYTVATHYLVVPFVGFIPYPYEFNTDSSEIDEVIGVPLDVFFDPDRRTDETWVLEDKPFPIISYRWGCHNIWGATARILDHFTSVLRERSGVLTNCDPASRTE